MEVGEWWVECSLPFIALFPGEKVVRFYHQFHTRISGIYTTCAKNLKGVNDSLGKVQDILRVSTNVAMVTICDLISK